MDMDNINLSIIIQVKYKYIVAFKLNNVYICILFFNIIFTNYTFINIKVTTLIHS